MATSGTDWLTRSLVEGAIPAGASCEIENFAGDDLVKHFVEGVKRGAGVDFDVWVSWCCPPDVSVLRTQERNILIRSERFDTLLVEYYDLQRTVARSQHTGLSDAITRSAVQKWYCEFLLGLGYPALSLASFEEWRQSMAPFPNHTFRDESLSTLSEFEKGAFQCFGLAHEIAHMVYPPRSGVSLDLEIDGITLRRHLAWELNQQGIDTSVQNEMLRLVEDRLDIDLLVTEIDADVSALGTIAQFLTTTFKASRSNAMEITLLALTAQSFLNDCLRTCRLLVQHHIAEMDEEAFSLQSWLDGQYMMGRTRVCLRRAGIQLYLWSQEDTGKSNLEINHFVQLVDSMFLDLQPQLLSLANAAYDEKMRLFRLINEARKHDGNERLDHAIDRSLSSTEDRVQMFYVMVAMGYQGGILHDLEGHLRNLCRDYV